jgi:3-isopropylmalate dehydrogenase
LFEFSFRLAKRRKVRGRPGRLACVDKANAFKAYAYFRKLFDECAARHTGVPTDRIYVDACAAMLVRRPWDFDVMVMENMFGDILSRSHRRSDRRYGHGAISRHRRQARGVPTLPRHCA